MAAPPRQDQKQEKATGFGSWNSFEQPSPVTYPAVDDSRHPDASSRSSQQPAAAPVASPTQQQAYQYPSPPTGSAGPQQQPASQEWAAFGGGQSSHSGQQQQPPAPVDDIWSSLDRNQPPAAQQKQEPRAAIVDSWASFDAPSDLGAPVASQQASQGGSNINSQDSWSAFDPGNNAGAGSRAGATAGYPPLPSSAAGPQAQQPQSMPAGPSTSRVTADRKSSVEEIPVQDLGLEGLTITAQPKTGSAAAQDFGSQPPPKPKRGSSTQFGSVFAPGSANSVNKLTNMFKKDKKGRQSVNASQPDQQQPESAPVSNQTASVSLPSTPSRQQGLASQDHGQFSEVDLWRPQSAQERQQCMDAYDHKVSKSPSLKDSYVMLLLLQPAAQHSACMHC